MAGGILRHLLAVIAGTTLLDAGAPTAAERVEIDTARGAVGMFDFGGHLYLQRHGLDSYTPPHLIDHPANLLSLAEAGADRILAICSCGSLRSEIAPGTLLAPDDFIAPELTLTLFGDARGHVVPGIDREWRARVLAAWAGADGPDLRDGGVYRQTPGPRFETPAEVRMLAEHADVVGMTMASECVIAGELEIPYAAICSVDNYANGVGERELTLEEFDTGVAETRERLTPVLDAVVKALATK